MDWKDYEYITKYIYEELGRKSGVKVIGFGNNFKVRGKSGVSHQVDILTSHSDGIHDYLTAIECKFWEKKINKDIVMKVASIIEDANIHKGVIVTKRGYTQDGISFAKQKNIGLVELREINDGKQNIQNKNASFPIGELIININIKRTRPIITNILFDFINTEKKLDIENTNHIIIKCVDGNEFALTKLLDSFKEELQNEIPNKSVKKFYKFENASLINKISNEKTQINGLTLFGELELKNMNEIRNFNIIDEVWLTMKSLFENNSYTISKLGMIKKK